jgi:hypothetical protein
MFIFSAFFVQSLLEFCRLVMEFILEAKIGDIELILNV